MELNQSNIDELLVKKFTKGESFSAGIKYKIENGRILVLTVSVLGKNFFIQTKFPGGKSENNDTPFKGGETPFETLEHEWMEETGRRIKKTRYIHHKILKDGHIQFFFFVEDDEEIGFPTKKDADTEFPKWSKAIDVLPNLHGQHKVAFIKLIEELSVTDKLFCEVAYMEGLLGKLKRMKNSFQRKHQMS